MTTSEARTLDAHSRDATLRPSMLVSPRGRRRPGLLVAGAAMVALGALAAIWLVSASGHRVEVVMLARDVPYGATLVAADLTTTAVAVDPAVAVVPADQTDDLVGRIAATNLAAGSLLSHSEVSAEGPLGDGEVLVPLPLPAEKLPAGGLAAGDRLLVVDAPPPGSDPPVAAPASFEARVVRAGSPDVNGTVVIDAVASTHDGPLLATRAATGRFAIVLLPVVQP